MKNNFLKITVYCSSIFFATFLYAQKIDRKAVVQRHNVVITKIDSLSSLTVGNGNFAFTVDATGLQSFPDAYAKGVPLGTQSVWGWHSFPNTENLKIEEAQKVYELEGRKISYTVQPKEPERAKKAVEYFRVNPHRLQLGNIGFEILKKDGKHATIEDIKDIHQVVDLWTGEIKSKFTVQGEVVKVSTICDSEQDAIGVNVESKLIKTGRLKILFCYPYPSGEWKDVGNNFQPDNNHVSILEKSVDGSTARILHQIDTTRYCTWLIWKGNGTISKIKDHYYLLSPDTTQTNFNLSVLYTPYIYKFDIGELQTYDKIKNSSKTGWQNFWLSGGAVDFSQVKDKRAFEIERRVVLSQYLTKVQCSSNYPPQETGLTYNSWYGKPHLEMHWWHAVHYAQWGRVELMEKSLDWYFKVADKALAIAKRQGFDGLRWQKMTDNEGNESPSSVGAFLIWQQPHFIYMAEMLYLSTTGVLLDCTNHYRHVYFL